MTKKDYEEMLQIYKDQITFFKEQNQTLREDNLKLQQQNFELQEGLLSIQAPDAYRDMRTDQIPQPEEDPEVKRRRQIYSEVLPQHLQNIEKPMWEGPEEMIRALARS